MVTNTPGDVPPDDNVNAIYELTLKRKQNAQKHTQYSKWCAGEALKSYTLWPCPPVSSSSIAARSGIFRNHRTQLYFKHERLTKWKWEWKTCGNNACAIAFCWAWCSWCRVQTLMDHKRRLDRLCCAYEYAYGTQHKAITNKAQRICGKIQASCTTRATATFDFQRCISTAIVVITNRQPGYGAPTMINEMKKQRKMFFFHIYFVYFLRSSACQRNRFLLLNDLCCAHWPTQPALRVGELLSTHWQHAIIYICVGRQCRGHFGSCIDKSEVFKIEKWCPKRGSLNARQKIYWYQTTQTKCLQKHETKKEIKGTQKNNYLM